MLKAACKPGLELDTRIGNASPRMHLSISHDGEYVVAYVVAEEVST